MVGNLILHIFYNIISQNLPINLDNEVPTQRPGILSKLVEYPLQFGHRKISSCRGSSLTLVFTE